VYVTGFSETDFITAQLKNNDTNGEQNWVRAYNGVLGDEDVSNLLLIAPNGDVLVGGKEPTLKNVRPGSAAQWRVSLGVIRYSTNGATRWSGRTSANLGISNQGEARSLALDTDESVFIAGPAGSSSTVGRFSENGTLSFSHGMGYLVLWGLTITANHSYSVVGVDQTAQIYSPAWFRSYGNPGAEGRAVALTPSRDIVVSGQNPSATTSNDIFVVKYSPNGLKLWEDVYDSASHQNDFARAMVIDQQGSIYVTGHSTTVEGGSEFVTIKYSDAPKIEKQASGAMQLEFYVSPGRRYALEATTDFLNWESWITNTADTNGVVRFEDGNAVTIPYRFYRGKTVP
jgi:hypothetical protein